MARDLKEVIDIVEAAGLTQEEQDAERAVMEAALVALSHGGVVYADTYGVTRTTFEWMTRNTGFLEAYFAARGDIFQIDVKLGMAYVRSGKPDARRLGIMKLAKDEILVGGILRATYDIQLSQGEGHRVPCNLDELEQALRKVADGSEDSVPSPRRVAAILAMLAERGCVRIVAGDKDGNFTILPGITVLFDNDAIDRLAGWHRSNPVTVTPGEADHV
jgi:hypothetical protein